MLPMMISFLLWAMAGRPNSSVAPVAAAPCKRLRRVGCDERCLVIALLRLLVGHSAVAGGPALGRVARIISRRSTRIKPVYERGAAELVRSRCRGKDSSDVSSRDQVRTDSSSPPSNGKVMVLKPWAGSFRNAK